LACGVHCGVTRKKISSLIKRYSGENERERRAYEEEPEVKDTNTGTSRIQEIVSKFEGGEWVYICLRYMDKFHTEPVEWLDLFNYLSYTDVEADITSYLRAIKKEQ
jgi:hypothetical protein